jgi:Uma2 family endonuclease
MSRSNHGGLREGTARQPELTGRRERLIRSAPTEPEAFLLWWGAQREREEGKFELSRGRVTCDMIWPSRHHARVCTNIIVELARRLDQEAFDIGAADFAVPTLVGVRSPEVVVDRGNPRGSERSTNTPILFAEVLSPSTAGKDFTEKLDEYTATASLQTYLICSQDEPRASGWRRQSDGAWPDLPVELVGRDATMALGGLGVELAMAATFRGIPDAPTVE